MLILTLTLTGLMCCTKCRFNFLRYCRKVNLVGMKMIVWCARAHTIISPCAVQLWLQLIVFSYIDLFSSFTYLTFLSLNSTL